MAEQNTQAVVLQQPSDQKLIVKIEQDSDWISIGALIVSFLAFVVTIYVVKKSTESQIKSNKDLVEAQNELLIKNKKIDLLIDKQNNLKNNALSYFDSHKDYVLYYLILAQELREFSFSRTSQSGGIEYEYVKEMTAKFIEVNRSYTKFRFELNSYFDQEEIEELLKNMEEVFKITLNLRVAMTNNDRNNIQEMCNKLNSIIENISFSINEALKKDSILYESKKPTV